MLTTRKEQQMKNKLAFGIMAFFIIGLTLTMTLVEARSVTITQEQIDDYTPTQIQTFLINNFEWGKPKYVGTNKIVFYFKTQSVREFKKQYTFYTYSGKAYLNRAIWEKCLTQYTFNQCKTALITNYGMNEQTGQTTIFQQARNSLIREYNKILSYKNKIEILHRFFIQQSLKRIQKAQYLLTSKLYA